MIVKGFKKDAALLKNLCRETFYKKWLSTNTENDLQTYMNEFFSIEKLESELANENIFHLIAKNDHEFIGYTKLNRNQREGNLGLLKSIELQRMYVLEKYIGKGIGKQLMNEALTIARCERFEVMWLGVWEKNDLAIKFYRQFGFEFYGSHEFVLGEDITTDLLMKKML